MKEMPFVGGDEEPHYESVVGLTIRLPDGKLRVEQCSLRQRLCDIAPTSPHAALWMQLDGKYIADANATLEEANARHGSVLCVRPRMAGGGDDARNRLSFTSLGVWAFIFLSLGVTLVAHTLTIPDYWYSFTTVGFYPAEVSLTDIRILGSTYALDDCGNITMFWVRPVDPSDCLYFQKSGLIIYAVSFIIAALFVASIIVEFAGEMRAATIRGIFITMGLLAMLMPVGYAVMAMVVAIGSNGSQEYPSIAFSIGCGLVVAGCLLAFAASFNVRKQPASTIEKPALQYNQGVASLIILIFGLIFNLVLALASDDDHGNRFSIAFYKAFLAFGMLMFCLIVGGTRNRILLQTPFLALVIAFVAAFVLDHVNVSDRIGNTNPEETQSYTSLITGVLYIISCILLFVLPSTDNEDEDDDDDERALLRSTSRVSSSSAAVPSIYSSKHDDSAAPQRHSAKHDSYLATNATATVSPSQTIVHVPGRDGQAHISSPAAARVTTTTVQQTPSADPAYLASTTLKSSHEDLSSPTQTAQASPQNVEMTTVNPPASAYERAESGAAVNSGQAEGEHSEEQHADGSSSAAAPESDSSAYGPEGEILSKTEEKQPLYIHSVIREVADRNSVPSTSSPRRSVSSTASSVPSASAQPVAAPAQAEAKSINDSSRVQTIKQRAPDTAPSQVALQPIQPFSIFAYQHGPDSMASLKRSGEKRRGTDEEMISCLGLFKDEKILRFCRTRKGMPVITPFAHVALTLLTFGVWLIIYLIQKCAWPQTDIALLLTDQRVMYWEELTYQKMSRNGIRALQQFTLDSVSAVQMTYSATEDGCCTSISDATIRIWNRRFPKYFPPTLLPDKFFSARAEGKKLLKKVAWMYMTGGMDGYSALNLLKTGAKYAIKTLSKLMDKAAQARQLFIANPSYIEFTWRPREKEKMAQSSEFVSRLCEAVASVQQGIPVTDSETDPVQVSEDGYTLVDKKTAIFAKRVYGIGANEKLVRGTVQKNLVTPLDIALSVLTFGLYYFFRVRPYEKTRSALIATSHRVITAITTRPPKKGQYDGMRKNVQVDVRQLFFGSAPREAGFVSVREMRYCVPSERIVGFCATKHGVICIEESRGVMQYFGTHRNTITWLMQSSASKPLIQPVTTNPMAAIEQCAEYFKPGELHAGSITGKGSLTCADNPTYYLTIILSMGLVLLYAPSSERTSLVLTQGRIFLHNRWDSRCSRKGYAVFSMPLSQATCFTYTEADPLADSCCCKRNYVPGFGLSGVQIETRSGKFKVPLARKDSGKDDLGCFLAQYSRAVAQNAQQRRIELPDGDDDDVVEV